MPPRLQNAFRCTHVLIATYVVCCAPLLALAGSATLVWTFLQGLSFFQDRMPPPLVLPLFSAALLGGAGLLALVLLGFLCVPATVLARRSIPTKGFEVVRPEQAGAILKTLCIRARIVVPVVVFYDDANVTLPAAWSYSTVWSSVIVLPQGASTSMPADRLRWLLARQCVLIQSGRAFFDALWLYVQLAILAAVRCFDTLVNGALRNTSTHPIAWLLAALAVSPVLLVSCVAAMSARAMRRCYPRIDAWLSSTDQTHEIAAITRIVGDPYDGPTLAKHA